MWSRFASACGHWVVRASPPTYAAGNACLINVMSSLLMFLVPCRCSCCSSFDACVPFPTRRFGSVAYSAGHFCAAGGGSCSCSCCYCCCRPTHREHFCSDLACSGCLRFGYPACFRRSVLCLQRVSGCSPSVRRVSPRLPVPCGHCAMSRDPFSGFVDHVCHPPCLQFPEPCGPCNLSAFHVGFANQHRCIACGELDVFAPPLAIIHVNAIPF